MKFFFLAHGVVSYECLKYLLQNGYKPAFVVTHKSLDYDRLKDSFYEPVAALAKDHSVPLFGVGKLIELKDSIQKTDIGVCVGFMEIIKKEILDAPKNGIVNVHGGKLPKYRGRAPISRSIMYGEKFFHLTLHQMDQGVDSGPVCLESAIPITDKDDINTLSAKCAAEAGPLVERFFEASDRNTLECREQNLLKNSKPFQVISGEERKIDWNSSSRGIFNLIRALIPPFPGAFFECKGKTILALRAELLLDNNVGKPGEVLFVEDNSLIIKCGNGSLNITSVSDENLNPVSIIDNFHKGDILE